MKLSKIDYATTLATLLSLDRSMIKNLLTLPEGTLSKMYHNYLQNAKDSANAIEKAKGEYQRGD